ncbi:MAG: DUF192 domain-containing protein [Holophagaceae bacterium]|nr:DUF192 domain-containing protein [Acidobacteriota bacterium]
MRLWLALLLSLPLLAGGGTVTFKQKAFLAEVAATEPEKAKGLMYRQSLAKDRCMFFVYGEDGYHAIWMKNCLIALDVAWLDAEGRVLETAENVPPCSPMRGDDCPTYGGSVPSRHFVEFAAGTFKRLGLKKGDRLGWELTLDDGRVVRGGPAAARSPKK